MEKDSFDHKVRDSLQTIREAKEHLRLIDEELAALTNQHAALQVSDEVFKNSSHDYSLPGSLIECNIAAGVKELAEGLQNRGLFTTFDVFGKVNNLEFHRGALLYRCIAELTDNIVRHSMATHVLIQLTFFAKSIDLYLEDNGIGFDLATENYGRGLASVQTKVDFLQGTLRIKSTNGKGTVISLSI